MEHLVYEHILNGGNVMLYGIYDFYTPLQMYYFAKALTTLDKYVELLKNGQPDLTFDCGNKHLAGTRFASDKEELIYIANYSSFETESVTLKISGTAVNVSTGEKIVPGERSFKLAPAEFILIHRSRKL